MRRLLLCVGVFLLVGGASAWAQTDGLLFIDDETHRFLQKQKTQGHLPGAFLSHQPLSTYEAQAYLDTLAVRDSEEQMLSAADRMHLDRLRGERPRPGAGWAEQTLSVYDNGRDLVAAEGDRYGLQLNPLYYGYVGPALRRTTTDRFVNARAWRNTRGLRLSGHVGDHLFVESRALENQWRPIWPAVTNNSAPRTAHISFYEDGDPYNFFEAMGIVGVHTRHFEVRLGRDRNHWGPGQGSLFLTDYSTVYDQVQLRATLWRLQYSYLLARFLNANPSETGPRSLFRPSRYGALHRLVVHVSDNVELELYEGVIMGRDTTAGHRSSGIDPAYLNPAVVFRAVERDLGSPDNALLGVGGAWTVKPGLRLYGQFLLDELRVSEIGNQWWANKWGWMTGLHLAEPGVPHLSVRAEAARLRPYLYSHFTGATAFTHMNDGLGHPSGPNSLDLALFMDVEPPGRWRALLYGAVTVRGRNTETENYGADPTESFRTRVRSRNVEFLQGVRQRQGLVEGAVEYELLPNLYGTLALRGEVVDDAERGRDAYLSPRLLLRWGLPVQSLRY